MSTPKRWDPRCQSGCRVTIDVSMAVGASLIIYQTVKFHVRTDQTSAASAALDVTHEPSSASLKTVISSSFVFFWSRKSNAALEGSIYRLFFSFPR